MMATTKKNDDSGSVEEVVEMPPSGEDWVSCCCFCSVAVFVVAFHFRVIITLPPVHEVVYHRVLKYLPLVRVDDLLDGLHG